VVIFQSRCEDSGSLFVFGWVVGVITMSLPLVPILSQAAFVTRHGQRQMRGKLHGVNWLLLY